MQKRHTDRLSYFQEQVNITENFIIPYIEEVIGTVIGINVAEIGCGEGGNLKPFLDRNCNVVGIDLAKNKIENAKRYFESHPAVHKSKFIAEDIYQITPTDIGRFDLIILRDTIEHIPNQEVFLGKLKDFLNTDGVIFFAFPPWRMPFGGHQQICENKFLSILPYFHLFPSKAYRFILKVFGESKEKIKALQEIKDTGISIAEFKHLLAKNNYTISREDKFLINPNYEIKFNLKTKKLPRVLDIPFICDFYTTAYYCIATYENSK